MISIIIPVLNEEFTIRKLLAHLVNQASESNNLEIIVVDGNSVDQTSGVVHAFAKAYPSTRIQFITAPKGRGTQMHAGSKVASHSILYFLHADSFPPENYDKYIIEAVNSGKPAGCFRMRFMSWHWWLIIIGWFTRFSWRVSRGGDQSQYITKELYEKLGGFNTSIPIYEDYDLIHKLYDNDTFYVIPKWLKTSARRYEEIGVLKLQWFYLTIYWKKRNGATIDEIYEYYLAWCQPKDLQESRLD